MLTGLKSIAELRATARANLKGNWGKSILTVVIYFILTLLINNAGSNSELLGVLVGLLTLVLSGAWSAGLLTYFLHLTRKESLSVKLLFSQLPRLFPFFKLLLLKILLILLWAIPALLPGAIARYFNFPLLYILFFILAIVPILIVCMRYSQSSFLYIDNPEMKAWDVLKRSKEIMQHQIWKYFLLHLSFIGWYLLCLLSLGIGLLWLVPYIYATQASFYEDLRLKYEKQQARLG